MEKNEILEKMKAKKKTLVKVILKSRKKLNFDQVQCFKNDYLYILIGDYHDILPQLEVNKDFIEEKYIEVIYQNASLNYLDSLPYNIRIEKGAHIRENVYLGNNVIIMMGACVNVGASILENTMIDMNAVIGSFAQIGRNCHIGAGAVIAGIIEPPSEKNTTIGDNTFIGANAVILEGICIGSNCVIGAGSVITHDIEDNSLVYGVPGKLIRKLDQNFLKINQEIR